MFKTYAKHQDSHGLVGPFVRFGHASTLSKALDRSMKALARGVVEVEIRTATNGKEFLVGVMTPNKTLFKENLQ